jgi:hypothetical protein
MNNVYPGKPGHNCNPSAGRVCIYRGGSGEPRLAVFRMFDDPQGSFVTFTTNAGLILSHLPSQVNGIIGLGGKIILDP